MKIEKVNDNQIRCTLTRQDLANRHLKLSELAYGTEKARELFHDMMQQANYEFGFEAEDIPLVIEAIPISHESIILIITKVEYPDELDTRFSKFSDAPDDFDEYSDDNQDIIAEGADDILSLFRKISEEKSITDSISDQKDFVPLKDTVEHTSPKTKSSKEDVIIPANLTRIFLFRNLMDITRLARILDGFFDGENTLYKEPNASRYHLVLQKNNLSPEVFNKVCNILSEYANQEPVTPATEAFFAEHYTILCKKRALQTFAQF
ncbi:MAG: adaptor protein MecA [Lachnospiraceae bacterium]|nr:adaptor protein MecA [Lachnospiraceae bacterium]